MNGIWLQRTDNEHERYSAYVARVNLHQLRQRLGECVPGFLAPEELAYWRAAPSAKRRLEFAGGRLACKLSVTMLRAARGMPEIPFEKMIVTRPDGRYPVCMTPDGNRYNLALSHAGDLACAYCSSGQLLLGVDAEPVSRELQADPEFFHPLEARRADGAEDILISWLTKEAGAKLLGDGISPCFPQICTIKLNGRRYVVLPRSMARRAAFLAFLLFRSQRYLCCVAVAALGQKNSL